MSPRDTLCVGLNKGHHHAAVCLAPAHAPPEAAELLLKERLTRVKADGMPLDPLLRGLAPRLSGADLLVAESSFMRRPIHPERIMNRHVRYFDFLRELGLERFTSRHNAQLRFVPHHDCHARAAAALSPFSRSLIVVLDGAGSSREAFLLRQPDQRPREVSPWRKRAIRTAEACTVYEQQGAVLRPVLKQWQTFSAPRRFPFGMSQGLGMLYEWAAHYIFRSRQDAGKVMGLAPFGRARPFEDRKRFILSWDWDRAFAGGGKRAWERSGGVRRYADLAASVQAHFEASYLGLLERLKRRFPEHENLILTGGCALNCVANTKAAEAGLFREIYVPPFPGDESIAFGAAQTLRLERLERPWRPLPWERQAACFGPRASAPEREATRRVFQGWTVRVLGNPSAEAARRLSRGQIVAWFQGRSESGPRALGHRSILASPLRRGVRDHLNARVKGREAFRPYGASVLWESAHDYFAVPRGFDSPFMSFAPRLREAHREGLKEIGHVDGTSRIQTVRASQDPLFHALIAAFGARSGVPVVLNTSLNVMGEPIVETVEDLKRFLEKTPVDCAIAGDVLIENN